MVTNILLSLILIALIMNTFFLLYFLDNIIDQLRKLNNRR